MHLQLKPGLRRVWRGPQTLQIGLDPRHGTVLDGLTADDRALVDLLGTGVDGGAFNGSDTPSRRRELLRLLVEAKVLVQDRAGRAALTQIGAARERLEADAQVWSVVHPESGDAWELLARRATRRVEVVGSGQTAVALVNTLVSAGVGEVPLRDTDATARDRPVEGAISTCVPDMGRADVVVLVEHTLADAGRAQQLMGNDVVHLSVVHREAAVVVGPLVIPGQGPCLRCLDLHRIDRDPGWPQVLAQLLSPSPGTPPPHETASSALAAALAALQVLAHLDGQGPAAALGATLEVELPDGLISRRPWPAHPACGCHWPPDLPVIDPEPFMAGTGQLSSKAAISRHPVESPSVKASTARRGSPPATMAT